MALQKGYTPGIVTENIKNANPTDANAKYYTLTGTPRKNNAGRKAIEKSKKKQRYTIAMTDAEHERALELQARYNFASLSSLLVELVNKEYDK